MAFASGRENRSGGSTLKNMKLGTCRATHNALSQRLLAKRKQDKISFIINSTID